MTVAPEELGPAKLVRVDIGGDRPSAGVAGMTRPGDEREHRDEDRNCGSRTRYTGKP